MNAPSWMKPHLRQRLEQERKEATRTGPVNGEKALVAKDGKVSEVVTDHKPLPPKNGLKPTDKVMLTVDDCRIEGIVMAIGGRLCCVAVKSVIGTVFVYRNIEELEPMPPKNGLVNERIDVEEVVEKFKELHDKYPPKLPPKNSFSPLEFGTDDDAPELGQEFFDKAIVTKPGESLVDKARGCGHFFDKMFEQLYGPFTHRFSTRMGWDSKPETWQYTYDNKDNLVGKRRVS